MHASTTSLAWVVDIYVLCFAGLLLPAGALGDRFGRKGALQCGLVVFIIAAVLASWSDSTLQLIAARAGMGVGAALVMPGTLSILATVFPPAERPRAIAIWASVAGGSVAVSILLTMPPATGAIVSSLPPAKAGVGSAVNDLARELGGAFGLGVLGSLTLSHYQSRLAPALADHPAAAIARRGLAQAFAAGHGSRSPLGEAARSAYSAGLDLAMIIGATFVLAAAIAVYLAMPAGHRPSAAPTAQSASTDEKETCFLRPALLHARTFLTRSAGDLFVAGNDRA